MRYSKVEYKDFLKPDMSVLLGVVIQDDKSVTTKFDLTPAKFELVKTISPEADWNTFRLFDTTFKESFLSKDVIVTSGNYEKKEFKITDPFFLKYLNQKYQNNYRFSEPEEIDDAKKVFDLMVSMGN